MKLLDKNDRLLDALRDDLSLISAVISKISIYNRSAVLCIDVELELMYKKSSNKILLRFIDVSEYSFYFYSDLGFYNVEIYKLFRADGFYYVSFDPVDENTIISDDDQDYIKAMSVEGYFLD